MMVMIVMIMMKTLLLVPLPNDDPIACMKDSDGDDWGDSNVNLALFLVPIVMIIIQA